jgi:hypothetical protein
MVLPTVSASVSMAVWSEEDFKVKLILVLEKSYGLDGVLTQERKIKSMAVRTKTIRFPDFNEGDIGTP